MFYEALADLADAPGLRYRSPSDDALSLDVSITAEGRGTGTVGFGGFDFDLLVLGDESYVKPVLPDILRDRPEAEALDRWIAVEHGPFTPLLEGLRSPGELATALRRALDETGDVPSGDVTIGGTDALAADTPAGEIYVSRQAPHQVLRYVPDGADDGPSPPPLPSIEPPPSLPDLSLPPTTLGLMMSEPQVGPHRSVRLSRAHVDRVGHPPTRVTEPPASWGPVPAEARRPMRCPGGRPTPAGPCRTRSRVARPSRCARRARPHSWR